MQKILAILLLILSFSIYAIDSDEIAKLVSDNISSEYAACAAYFSIAAEAVSRSGNKEISEQYKNNQDIALNYSVNSSR